MPLFPIWPRQVDEAEHIRYCGSPIPLSYGEADQEKTVSIVEFDDTRPSINMIPIPRFQPLERIAGSLDEITSRLNQLCRDRSNAWLEIEYTGVGPAGNLRETVNESIASSSMEIGRIKNKTVLNRVLTSIQDEEMLENIDVHRVFESCLETILPHERNGLRASYKEILQLLGEKDPRAD